MEKPKTTAESSDVFDDEKGQRRGKKKAVSKSTKQLVDKLSKMSVGEEFKSELEKTRQPRYGPRVPVAPTPSGRRNAIVAATIEIMREEAAMARGSGSTPAARATEVAPTTEGQGTMMASPHASPQCGDGSRYKNHGHSHEGHTTATTAVAIPDAKVQTGMDFREKSKEGDEEEHTDQS